MISDKNKSKQVDVNTFVGFLRLPQVLALYPVGKSSWYAGVKSGKYPQSVKLTERCTAWRAEDIHDLILSHVATSENSTNTSNKNLKEENHE